MFLSATQRTRSILCEIILYTSRNFDWVSVKVSREGEREEGKVETGGRRNSYSVIGKAIDPLFANGASAFLFPGGDSRRSSGRILPWIVVVLPRIWHRFYSRLCFLSVPWSTRPKFVKRNVADGKVSSKLLGKWGHPCGMFELSLEQTSVRLLPPLSDENAFQIHGIGNTFWLFCTRWTI